MVSSAFGRLLLAAQGLVQAQPPDPLPSWNDCPAKARIVAFVRAVTDAGSKIQLVAVTVEKARYLDLQKVAQRVMMRQ